MNAGRGKVPESRVAVAVVAGAAVLAALVLLVRQSGGQERTVDLAGGTGASIPSASPAEQGLDPAALDAAAATVARAGARAFLVARRGHLVHEWYREPDAAAGLPSPLLSRLVLAAGLAAQPGDEAARIAAAREAATWSASGMSAADAEPGGLAPDLVVSAISRELWQPMDAATARYAADRDGRARVGCCLRLRPRDGLALVTALADGGEVGGQRLLPPPVAAAVLEAHADGVAPRGPEAFGARAARLWRDGGGTRVYHFPDRRLVVLLMGADESGLSDETGPAHQVLRGIVDLPAATPDTRAIDTLVPNH